MRPARSPRSYLPFIAVLGPVIAVACAGDDATGGAAGGVDAGENADGDGVVDATTGPEDGGLGGDGSVVFDATGGDASGSDCTSTIAVVGGGASSAFATTFTRGAWATTSLAGSIASAPGITALGGGFLAVTLDSSSAVSWTAAPSGHWSPLAAIAGVSARDAVALVAVGQTAHLVVQEADLKYYHRTYASSWSAANDPVGGAGVAQSGGPVGEAAASIAGKLVVSQDGNDGNVYAQTLDGGWQKSVVAGGPVDKTIRPQLIGLGGAPDAMVVYAHDGDQRLAFATRTGATWSAPATIDAAAYTRESFSAVAMSGGRVLVTWHGVDAQSPSYFSIYAGGAWGKPAPLLANNPKTTGAPQLAAGVCGADALAVFIGTDGKAQLTRLVGAAWSSPEVVPGASSVVGAAVASTP